MTERLGRRAFGSIVAGSLLAPRRLEGQAPPSRPSNDNLRLEPRTDLPGGRLAVDFPGLRIGAAEYAEGPTGCTVFHFTRGGQCAADVRGGSPGVLMARDGWVDAVCFVGGSIYGLEAATGVSAELFQSRGHSTQWDDIALVRAAVIFDYRARENAVYPDKALGRAAFRAAREGAFALGPRGAGASATVGKMSPRVQREPAGQGGAFRRIGPTRVAVFTVVNAVGAIVDRTGRVVRGNLGADGRRLAPTELVEPPARPDAGRPSANTTLTLVATNQKLDAPMLTALGRQVHASMARALQPLHAWNDGDVLFAVTTNEVDNDALGVTALGVAASEMAWDAVLVSFEP